MRYLKSWFLFCSFFFCLPFVFAKSPRTTKETVPDIDIVYTWVDSSDTQWQALRAQYVRQEFGMSRDGNSTYRFRSRDELRYSLRSILQFAPYVRHIYIVTNGQVPSWFQPHPKITVISHSEIFRKQEHLPTFNSMAIESCLHRIPGLSEFYVYFNDDVFLGRPTTFESFFTKKGKVRFFLTDRGISREPVSEHTIGYQMAIRNTDELLSEKFSREKRYHLGHTPDPERKSVVQAIEKRFPKIFAAAETHRFRGADDYALTNGLIPYAAWYLDLAVDSKASFKKVILRGDFQNDEDVLSELIVAPPLFFCIEDCQSEENKDVDALLKDTLETLFPDKAPWEKGYVEPVSSHTEEMGPALRLKSIH